MRIHRQRSSTGFTIIEVLIVLAIASLILVIVFIAVPTLQRNQRNTRRKHDAALLLTLVRECMENNNYIRSQCATPDQIGFSPSMFSIYSGVHYGAPSINVTSPQVPPTLDEPNWLYSLKCSINGTLIVPPNVAPSNYVVGYFLESNNAYGYTGHCMEGGT